MKYLYHKNSSQFTVHSSQLMRRGQSLIEVLVAIGVVALLAISLVTTTLLTQRSARTARNNTQATNLAQQNIEQMRVFRDRKGFSLLRNDTCLVLDASDDMSDPSVWELADETSVPPVVCPEQLIFNNTVFERSIVIANGANSFQKLVTVTVSWQDTGGLQTVNSVTVLSDCVNNSSGC